MIPVDHDIALKWLQSIHPSIEPILLQYQCGKCSYEDALAKIVPYIYQWYSQSPNPYYYRHLYSTIASILQQIRPHFTQNPQKNGNQNSIER